jgi:hypothetical protein
MHAATADATCAQDPLQSSDTDQRMVALDGHAFGSDLSQNF